MITPWSTSVMKTGFLRRDVGRSITLGAQSVNFNKGNRSSIGISELICSVMKLRDINFGSNTSTEIPWIVEGLTYDWLIEPLVIALGLKSIAIGNTDSIEKTTKIFFKRKMELVPFAALNKIPSHKKRGRNAAPKLLFGNVVFVSITTISLVQFAVSCAGVAIRGSDNSEITPRDFEPQLPISSKVMTLNQVCLAIGHLPQRIGVHKPTVCKPDYNDKVTTLAESHAEEFARKIRPDYSYEQVRANVFARWEEEDPLLEERSEAA